LVLANNILFHLGPNKATRFIHNAASMLKKNGVISLGRTGVGMINMGTFTEPSELKYHTWIERVTPDLKNDLGLKRVEIGKDNLKQTLFYR
jgi:hypothetical protein